MSALRLFLVVLLIVGSRGQAPSQTPAHHSGGSTPPPAQLKPFADILAGTWKLTWLDTAGQVIGGGGESWKVEPGGVLVEENRSTVNGRPSDDYAAMWWDSKAQTVHGIWCDREINDEGCSGFDAVVTKGEVVLTGSWEQQGKRIFWRETFERKGAQLTQALFIGETAETTKLAGTIRGRRQ